MSAAPTSRATRQRNRWTDATPQTVVRDAILVIATTAGIPRRSAALVLHMEADAARNVIKAARQNPNALAAAYAVLPAQEGEHGEV